MARYRVIAHTADTGIESTAASLADLIGNLAFAMFDLMYDVDRLPAGRRTTFEVASPTPSDLAVDVLSELLYRSESDDVAFAAVVVAVDASGATVQADARSLAGAALQGPPIKAITYHDLTVEEQPDGSWFGRVIFDV